MPRPKTSGRQRKPRRRFVIVKTQGGAAASWKAPAPSAVAPMERSLDGVIEALDMVRKRAIESNRTAAAVQATIAMGRLLRLLPDKPGRTSTNLLSKLARTPAALAEAPVKFDGNYNDAVRRIALLLRLADKEKTDEAHKSETANGQKT